MAILTIQPADKDTFFYAAQNTVNNGSADSLNILADDDGAIRSILQFDFSAIPPVTITSATLSLTVKSGDGDGRSYWAYRLTQTAWVELQATWNEYSTGNSWASAGGDFTVTDGNTVVVPTVGQQADWDVTSLVQYFINNDGEIANFLIKDDAEGPVGSVGSNFYSSDFAGTVTWRPKLTINYIDSEASITLPQLSVSAFSSPGIANLSLPVLSVLAQGGAGADLTFPQFTTDFISLIHADSSITLPLLTLDSVPPPTTITFPLISLDAAAHSPVDGAITLPSLTLEATGNALRGIAQITLPQFATDLSGLSGSTEGTTLELPTFTISIRTGLTVSTLLPQLTLAATAQSGFVGTYNKSLPRMTVNVKATQQSRGINSITLPMFTLDASLKTGEISLTSTRDLPGLRLGATGFVGVPGDADLTFPAFELSVFGYQGLQGTVVQSLKMLTLDAYADVYTNRII